MSPQLLWTIAGLVLTVLTLGGVTISSMNSAETASSKLVASEVANVAIASKFWLINASTTNNFTGISAEGMGNQISDLTYTGTGSGSRFTSKASPSVKYAVSSVTPFKVITITAEGISFDHYDEVKKALTGRACALAEITPATNGNTDGVLTFTCES